MMDIRKDTQKAREDLKILKHINYFVFSFSAEYI